MLVGLGGAVGLGWFAQGVLQGTPSFWPALAVFGGALWLFLVIISVQMIRLPANQPGPLGLERRHEGLRASWTPHAYRLWTGFLYGAYQLVLHALFLSELTQGMVHPTPSDRIVYAVAFTLSLLSLAMGLLAGGAHVVVRGSVELEADADELSIRWGRTSQTFAWPTLEVRLANGVLCLKDDTGSVVVPVQTKAATSELLDVLKSRAGRSDDRLPTDVPVELNALVAGS